MGKHIEEVRLKLLKKIDGLVAELSGYRRALLAVMFYDEEQFLRWRAAFITDLIRRLPLGIECNPYCYKYGYPERDPTCGVCEYGKFHGCFCHRDWRHPDKIFHEHNLSLDWLVRNVLSVAAFGVEALLSEVRVSKRDFYLFRNSLNDVLKKLDVVEKNYIGLPEVDSLASRVAEFDDRALEKFVEFLPPEAASKLREILSKRGKVDG